MNSSNGGPHILLFERDQQMTALLMSEFQLAGYECHAARTAVEVFDAIARFPVRLVLVNLAQAAAARREFWVALDTQRRGKGVQVLTLHCTNIAGYGPADTEERSQTMLADIEVDGMRGVKNLVEAVRARIPGSTTGSMSRIPAQGTSDIKQPPGNSLPLATQGTAPLPLTTTSNNTPIATAPVETGQPQVARTILGPVPTTTTTSAGYPSMTGTQPDVTVQAPLAPNNAALPPRPVVVPPNTPIPMPATGTQEPVGRNRMSTPTPSLTNKIRAVIYPNSRNAAPQPAQETTRSEPQSTQFTAQNPQKETQGAPASVVGATTHPAHGNTVQPPGQPLQAIPRPVEGPNIAQPPENVQESSLAQLSRMVQARHIPNTDEQREAIIHQSTRPMALSDLTLRTSPIQDLRIEPEPGRREERSESRLPVNDISEPSAPMPTLKRTGPLPEVSTETKQVQASEAESHLQDARNEAIERVLTEEIPPGPTNQEYLLQPTKSPSETHGPQEGNIATDNALLLDIVQSLPPMPSPSKPPPQQTVLNGRATRSLGSVLLEGHLVLQDRLEVALQIQRMLRGVDMHYQLGEILLMFKLLTHDQLLAASLVSYGLITTAQISALGRIRQELHSIGLEYDLESLLMLFRIITPEQLREVRISWSG